VRTISAVAIALAVLPLFVSSAYSQTVQTAIGSLESTNGYPTENTSKNDFRLWRDAGSRLGLGNIILCFWPRRVSLVIAGASMQLVSLRC